MLERGVGESSSIGIESSSPCSCVSMVGLSFVCVSGGGGSGGKGWLLLVKKASVEEAKEEIDRELDDCCVL